MSFSYPSSILRAYVNKIKITVCSRDPCAASQYAAVLVDLPSLIYLVSLYVPYLLTDLSTPVSVSTDDFSES